ncbi:hypothetical protein NE237_017763 [Protea cynaroides]|uniref:Uncharacterized protein n=1 Tax=Protea cynaroides TaxID=273540 RepID=A0A9Q0K8L7_9MAGN|nr:hypothetical protein NE237_017763 [Protea cynaroides]
MRFKSQIQQIKPIYGLIYKSSKPGIYSYFNIQKRGMEIDFNFKELISSHYRKRNLSSNSMYYKVVITFIKLRKRVFDPVSYKCKVFTSRDKEGGEDCNNYGFWRELDMPATFNLAHCQPCLVNGVLHWMAHRILEDRRTELGGYILLMDLASEEFRVIKRPVPPTSWVFYVLEMKGSLCISCRVSDNQVDLGSFNLDPVIIFLCNFKDELIFYNLDTKVYKVEHKRIGVRNIVIPHVNSISPVNLSNSYSFRIHILFNL